MHVHIFHFLAQFVEYGNEKKKNSHMPALESTQVL